MDYRFKGGIVESDSRLYNTNNTKTKKKINAKINKKYQTTEVQTDPVHLEYSADNIANQTGTPLNMAGTTIKCDDGSNTKTGRTSIHVDLYPRVAPTAMGYFMVYDEKNNTIKMVFGQQIKHSKNPCLSWIGGFAKNSMSGGNPLVDDDKEREFFKNPNPKKLYSKEVNKKLKEEKSEKYDECTMDTVTREGKEEIGEEFGKIVDLNKCYKTPLSGFLYKKWKSGLSEYLQNGLIVFDECFDLKSGDDLASAKWYDLSTIQGQSPNNCSISQTPIHKQMFTDMEEAVRLTIEHKLLSKYKKYTTLQLLTGRISGALDFNEKIELKDKEFLKKMLLPEGKTTLKHYYGKGLNKYLENLKKGLEVCKKNKIVAEKEKKKETNISL